MSNVRGENQDRFVSVGKSNSASPLTSQVLLSCSLLFELRARSSQRSVEKGMKNGGWKFDPSI